MRSETAPSGSFDAGLLSPATVGHDALVADDAVLAALVTAELGLVRAWSAVGALPAADAESIAHSWGRAADDRGEAGPPVNVSVSGLAAAAVSGGNPVIPLVPLLKNAAPAPLRSWVHRGATSQDILDTALMLVAREAVDALLADLSAVDAALATFASGHRSVVAAGRTLGQHAVPTTVGLRAAGWLSGVRRAEAGLRRLRIPAQLGGAAGTRASFLQFGGEAATALPACFAETLGLDDVESVWHTDRWPVTELADALASATDALGTFAGDVVTLSRTEIGELTVANGGASSAMPQKNNPVGAVLIRSAALRAPQLAATLHLCSALAADERPSGAWHAEWPTLRELMRVTLGAAAQAARLAGALTVDGRAVARNLALTDGLIVAERLSIVLTPLIGAERVASLIAAAVSGDDLAALLRRIPEAASLGVDELLDPAGYTGEAVAAVERIVAGRPTIADLSDGEGAS